jgi:hypothetical protein
MTTGPYFPLNELAEPGGLPLGDILDDVLDHFWITRPGYDASTSEGLVGVFVDQPVSLPVPGLSSVQLAIGGGSGIEAEIRARFMPQPSMSVELPLVLRIDAEVLRPLKPGTKEPDLESDWLDITLGTAKLSLDTDGNIDLQWTGAVSVPRCMVGTTGVLLEIGKLQWVTPATQNKPPKTPTGFTGVYFDDVFVEIPQLSTAINALRMDEVFLGTGGFSGKVTNPNITLSWDGTKFQGPLAGELFGFKGGLSSAALEFSQNALVACNIAADIYVPYLEKRIGLTLGLNGTGGLTATAGLPRSQPAETGVTPGGPGYLLHLDVAGVLGLDVDAVRFTAPAAGPALFTVSGRVAPGAGVLQFPPVDLRGLSIDTNGAVQVDGGMLDLPQQHSLNFHGFQLEITKLGFGRTEDGGKWIGFSGGIKLVEGMPAGAAVEGLRIVWYEDGSKPVAITLNGVGVELEVPEVLRFKGAVSYIAERQQFHGAIELDLLALDMEVDATVVFGVSQGQTYCAIYLAAELPAGIPLWATGLALYGMAGLFAVNMVPDRRELPWYAIPPTPDWYHKDPPGVTDLLRKWTNHPGSLALGAGVTIGTVADNGYAFSGKMLLVILLPGPVLLLEGGANLLQERSTLATEPAFRALAVLDNRAGTFLVGLDARYRYGSGGELIDIRGGAQAFFDFHDASRWHLYLGEKDPRAKRFHAGLFRLFEADAYVMLDAHQLALGAWVGYRRQWQFGPLSASLEAWIDSNARVSFKPPHFHGDLWLHGRARVAAFGFGVGMTVDARIDADVFDPFHVRGEFSVAIDLPWPFTDLRQRILLEWGPIPTPPPLPLPLKEIAVEHFKATTSWSLPRTGTNKWLLPNYDRGDGYLVPTPPTFNPNAPAPANTPVVPLDCRPHLTFGRSVNDDARVGVNVQPVAPEWERIGDPATNTGPVRARYGLKEVALEKWVGGTTNPWRTVARKGTTPNGAGVRQLYGSWAPVPQMPHGGGPNTGQVKLWVWSKTPFNYTRLTGRSWDEWFTNDFGGYPCGPLLRQCLDFESIDPVASLPGSWSHPDQPGLVFSAGAAGHSMSIAVLDPPVAGLTQALRFSSLADLRIELPKPVDELTIVALDENAPLTEFIAEDPGGEVVATAPTGSRQNPSVRLAGDQMVRLGVEYAEGAPTPTILAQGVAAAIGSAYVAARNTVLFVEFGAGRVSAIDLTTNQYTVRGTGYDRPEDIAVTDDGTVAYVTERAGTLLRLDLTQPTLDRAHTAVVTSGMTAPQQIALDPAARQRVTGGQAYVVEYTQSETRGRLLRIDLASGQQTALVSDLQEAVGLLLAPDASAAYVSEQAGGRISRIPLPEGSREVLIEDLTDPFFLRWADANHNRILLTLRDPANSVFMLDLRQPGGEIAFVATGVPHRPSSVLVLPDDRLVVCSETVVSAYDLRTSILQLCLVHAPRMIRHIVEETARWSQEGEVLEPYTQYRLKAVTTLQTAEFPDRRFNKTREQTEYAFFRTEGPPGVTALLPPAPPQVPAQSGLDDLTRYVRQTVPISVWAPGQQPAPPRPVYRAYDVGVEFNENYVDLLYRLARRDLTLRLYDTNGPVRDVTGRAVVLDNRWGRSEQVTRSERDERWLAVLSQSGCGLTDPIVIRRDTALLSPTEGVVLAPNALVDARLMPVLLHEDFARIPVGTAVSGPAGRLDGWIVRDGPGSSPGTWVVQAEGDPPSHFVRQTTPAQTMLLREADPGAWSDYRVGISLRWATDGAGGVVFRYQDASRHYRFEMDRQAKRRRLVKVSGGVETVLDQDERDVAINQDQDYRIAIEAIGSQLRVVQDGTTVFAVTNDEIPSGSIALYCKNNPGARFGDVRVDDFRADAPVAYRFPFTTSRFTDFFHHLHSFQDETWRAQIPPTADTAPHIAAAVPPTSLPPTQAETRAYDALGAQVQGSTPGRGPANVEVTRIDRGAVAIALHVESSEPIDWKRTVLQVRRAGAQGSARTIPGTLKVTDVTFGTHSGAQPNDESVTLLIREPASLTGHRIEYRTGTFDDELLHEPFDAPVLGRWTFVDEGDQQVPSQWAVVDSALRETRGVFGGSPDPGVPDKPGTHAVGGAAAWTDYRLTVQLASNDPTGAIGVMVRYRDADNYYRFAMDLEGRYRRLVKKVAGSFSVLWQDTGPVQPGHEYALAVQCDGARLTGYLDGTQLFQVEDGDINAGRIGLYCWANTGARFDDVLVEAPRWVSYYAFGQEDPLPVGTRVRVYSGNERAAPPPESGLIRRFIASGNDPGALNFPFAGVDLRVVNPNGTIAHTRRFLPGGDYASVPARVLRKADGTAFFIVVPSADPAGSHLIPGQYRLQLTYRRDNRAVDPDSQVLSAAGRTTPEQPTIDIPW